MTLNGLGIPVWNVCMLYYHEATTGQRWKTVLRHTSKLVLCVERTFQSLSMDFISDFPKVDGMTSSLLFLIDSQSMRFLLLVRVSVQRK